jgi:hypothetical protein
MRERTGVTARSPFRRLSLLLAILLTACAAGGGESSDDAKNHGFYGSVFGAPP